MAPFDSLRDYAAALEKRGKFIRIKEMDQDRYEATAFYCNNQIIRKESLIYKFLVKHQRSK